MNSETGKWIIFLGILLLLIGVVIYFLHDYLRWIGHLPGDIRIEKENVKIYFPITTMILFSILLSCLIWVIRRML